VQLGQKKPILRQYLGPASNSEAPDSECSAPVWQRNPIRVTFQPRSGKALNFAVRGHAADASGAQ
jgi:hypothetical protein